MNPSTGIGSGFCITTALWVRLFSYIFVKTNYRNVGFSRAEESYLVRFEYCLLFGTGIVSGGSSSFPKKKEVS